MDQRGDIPLYPLVLIPDPGCGGHGRLTIRAGIGTPSLTPGYAGDGLVPGRSHLFPVAVNLVEIPVCGSAVGDIVYIHAQFGFDDGDGPGGRDVLRKVELDERPP